jgi:hypothetical protein
MLLEIVKILRDEPRYAVAGRRIDKIGRHYAATVTEEERLGLQRSVARMAFIAATDKGASFETVSKRFWARYALGFDNVCSELAVLVEFAYACAEFGKRNAGFRVLAQAQERLDGSGMKPRSAFVRQQTMLIEACQRRLKGDEAG